MLINFDSIVQKYGKPNGIIHIGAHLMEERDSYVRNNIDHILWIEANPDLCSDIQSKIEINNNEKILCATISDVDNDIVNFYITNNGQSSSILELDIHNKYYPHIYIEKTIPLQTKRMDTLIKEHNINISNYNFLNIDIQGAELLALKGFGNLLHNISYIYSEINTNTLYKNCALLTQIDNYLKSFNFDRVETSMTNFEWGDALYIRK
jgi:FkbM family methyltransferase